MVVVWVHDAAIGWLNRRYPVLAERYASHPVSLWLASGHALEKGSETERKKGLSIQQALADTDFDALRKKILKADGGRLASKATKGLLGALAAEADTYLRDYETLENALEDIARHQTDQRIWQLNRHGLLLGHALLAGYQEAKSQQGVIDFIDYRADWVRSMNTLFSYLSRHWNVTDHWPTFNVADIWICAGVGLMADELEPQATAVTISPP